MIPGGEKGSKTRVIPKAVTLTLINGYQGLLLVISRYQWLLLSTSYQWLSMVIKGY